MSDIDYPYSQGDRLEERNTYFYSQYHGAAFFPAWRTSRQAALMQLPPAQAVPLPVAAERNEYPVDTAALLAELLHAAADAPGKRRLAERLLQRFGRSHGAGTRCSAPRSWSLSPAMLRAGRRCTRRPD